MRTRCDKSRRSLGKVFAVYSGWEAIDSVLASIG